MVQALLSESDDAVPLHPAIARNFRHRTTIDSVLTLSHVSNGVATGTPTAGVYARTREGGLDDAAVLIVEGPDVEKSAYWLYSRDIQTVAELLLSDTYVVTYTASPHVEPAAYTVHVTVNEE
jgi:hypothetical protein